MIVIRYFFWLMLYHLLTFYKQRPVAFLIGCVMMPYYALDRFFHPPDLHKEIVSNGVDGLKSYWQVDGAIAPPNFVRERFEALRREAQ